MTSLALTWGTTPAERTRPFPCDALLDAPDAVYYRGVTVAAPAADVFRWLCQLRVAPYSYDWLDNLGRRSPRALTPGLGRLAVGQRVMTIFDLAAFEPGRHLTLRIRPGSAAARLFGDIAGSYLIDPGGPARCRLLAKLAVRYPRGPVGWLMRAALPWGDLFMMRKQLPTLKAPAEGRR